MRVAFVYDRINKIGGAERVLSALHHLWPQAPFYTAVYKPTQAPFAKTWNVRPSFMQSVPFASSHHELFPWLTPFAFESFNFSNYDVVISITSAEAKGIITSPHTLHVCYCLTPTRYLYSHKREYQDQGPLFLKPLQKLILKKLKTWDQVASTRPDHYLAISSTVQKRIKKYYHRPSQIIYPPTNTDFFKPSAKKSLPKDFFLVVSRLVKYKNIELIIKAFNQLKRPLIIVGTGKQSSKLKKLAGPNITFVGKLTDKQLLSYYQECLGLVFASVEDFGLTIIEAQSTGKPVIAFQKGGAAEIIKSNSTGIFFDKLTPSSLINAISSFNHKSFNPQTIRRSAQKFSHSNFKTQFKSKINTLWQKHKTNHQ